MPRVIVIVVGVDARDMVGALATISAAVLEIVADAVADVTPGEVAAYFI